MQAWAATDRFGPSDVASRFGIRALLIGLLLVSLGGLVLGALHRAVNGDEFYFLTNIYRTSNDQSLYLLQTAYTHMFGWLTRIGGDEIVQIKVGRLVCVAIWIVSIGLLYRLGTRLTDPHSALAGVAFFALFSYSVGTASDFRIDGILLPILLAIALLLSLPSMARVAAAGALSGVALALSVKAILWAPAFAGVLAIGIWNEPGKLKRVLAGGIGVALTFGLVMLGHYILISGRAAEVPTISAKGVAEIGSRMLLEEGFFPKLHYLWRSILENPVTWLFIVVGGVLALIRLRAQRRLKAPMILLALTLPLTSLAFYTNAFPYAYLVLVPTACLLAGQGFSYVVGNGKGMKGVVGLVCLATAALPLVKSIWEYRIDRLVYQKQVLSVIHTLFEQPVPYIDASGMVSSFPRPLFPMSAWGFKNYKKAGKPVLRHYIEMQHPPFLIVNTPALDILGTDDAQGIDPLFRLLPEDSKAIQATYTHYWGQIYLAGRRWHSTGAGETLPFEIVIPGHYTLLAKHSIIVDGRLYDPGAAVLLNAGRHEARTLFAESDLRILWGRTTEIPTQVPSQLPLYSPSFGKEFTTRCLLATSSC